MKKLLLVGLILVISVGASMIPRATVVSKNNALSSMIKTNQVAKGYNSYFDIRF